MKVIWRVRTYHIKKKSQLTVRTTGRVRQAWKGAEGVGKETLGEWRIRREEKMAKFLADALTSRTQSSKLLLQIKTQARSKLGEERKVTTRYTVVYLK